MRVMLPVTCHTCPFVEHAQVTQPHAREEPCHLRVRVRARVRARARVEVEVGVRVGVRVRVRVRGRGRVEVGLGVRVRARWPRCAAVRHACLRSIESLVRELPSSCPRATPPSEGWGWGLS